MVLPGLRSRLPVAALLAAATLGIGWLLFGVAGDRTRMMAVADAGDRLEVHTLADARRDLTIDAVTAQTEEAWSQWNGQGYIHADDGDAVWVRVVLRNSGDAPLRGVLADSEYFSDRVELWEDGGGGWRRWVSGEAVRAAEKPIWTQVSAFLLDVPAGGERTVYLRVWDRFAVWARVVWWPEAGDFFAAQIRDLLAEAGCYGALLGLLIYHALLWERLRHPDTGYYVLYATTMMASNFIVNGGLALAGLAVASPWKETMFAVALAGSGVFLVQFAREFLETATRMPTADRWARGFRTMLIVLAAGALLIPWLGSAEWVQRFLPLVGLAHALLLGMAVVAWRRGARHARFFVAASGVMFAGALPVLWMWIVRDVQKSAALGVLAGSTLEILLLAFAVADRFAQAQREKAEAQRRLLEEAAAREAVQEAYADELELEVRERTRELGAANADKDRMITVLGHDLRGPLTGLTRAAEQTASAPTPWALVQFAQDAADTGRTLLLMIEDLVLWARLRAGSRHVTDCAVHMLVAPAAVLHRNNARGGGVSVEIDVPEELRVETDLVLMQTLVRNLVDNAVKHARSVVAVQAREEGDWVRLEVRDDGPGLPASVATWLTRDGVEAELGGRELGLRLCREIARTLELRMDVRKADGGGTVFSFRLKRSMASV